MHVALLSLRSMNFPTAVSTNMHTHSTCTPRKTKSTMQPISLAKCPFTVLPQRWHRADTRCRRGSRAMKLSSPFNFEFHLTKKLFCRSDEAAPSRRDFSTIPHGEYPVAPGLEDVIYVVECTCRLLSRSSSLGAVLKLNSHLAL